MHTHTEPTSALERELNARKAFHQRQVSLVRESLLRGREPREKSHGITHFR